MYFGTITYGKVDRIPGLCHVATQFFHFNFFPIYPLGTFAMLEGREGEGLPLPLSGKSVMMAYARAITFVAAGYCFIGILMWVAGHPENFLKNAVGLLVTVGLFTGTYLLQSDAGYSRACEIVNSLDLGDEAVLWVENVYGKLLPGEFEERSEVFKKEREAREFAYEKMRREVADARSEGREEEVDYEARMRAARREDPTEAAPTKAPAAPKKGRIVAKGAAHFDNKATRPCPECGKEIRSVARLCKFCRVRF